MLLVFRAVRNGQVSHKNRSQKKFHRLVVDWVERGAGEVSTSKFLLSMNIFIRKKKGGCSRSKFWSLHGFLRQVGNSFSGMSN